jgi:hypothetical protein
VVKVCKYANEQYDKCITPEETGTINMTNIFFKHNQRMSKLPLSNINPTTIVAAVIMPATGDYGRFNFPIFKGVKEIITTGFEMTNVVIGGDVNSLLAKQAAASLTKIKWVFS